MDNLTTERSFDSQATYFIDALGLFFFGHVIHGWLSNQALVVAQSTDAGIKCTVLSITLSTILVNINHIIVHYLYLQIHKVIPTTTCIYVKI